jgi:hypothetical protein
VKASSKVILLFLMLGLALAGPAKQTNVRVRLDNSDWWSLNRSADADDSINLEKREFTKSNFQIVGIDLNDRMFSNAAARLGTSTIVERGDASTGRHQACYVSADGTPSVHLIFEQGEVNFTFYIFSDGPVWEGIDRCVTSKRVSLSLATASGLHLGQTRVVLTATREDTLR